MKIFRRLGSIATFGWLGRREKRAAQNHAVASKKPEPPKSFSWEDALKAQGIPETETNRMKIIYEARKNLGMMWKKGEFTEAEFVGVYARHRTRLAELEQRNVAGEIPTIDAFIKAYLEAKSKKK